MTLSFSYIAPLINFKVSCKDPYKKRAPLAVRRAYLAIDLLFSGRVFVRSLLSTVSNMQGRDFNKFLGGIRGYSANIFCPLCRFG